jgi:transcription termination factor Rho
VKQLKEKPLTELAALADELRVENAAGMRVQDLVFAILKAQAAKRGRIYAEGVLETLPDGFGFLRAPEAELSRRAPTTSTSRRRRSAASTCARATP